MIAFRDRNLEELRRLLTLKEAVASPDFRSLADGVENPALRDVLLQLREEAPGEQAELTDVLNAWMRAGGSQELPDVGSREIVVQWADLHEASARRMRYASAFAPNDRLRQRLLALAERDDAHAQALRALL